MNIMPKMKKRRAAIAMIELIFSIVIIGLVMLSAPMLIDRSTKSTYIALQQESIAAAAAQINMIMTAEWDNSNTFTTEGAPVLQTASTSTAITNCNTQHPVGVTSSSGRYCNGLASPTTFFNAGALGLNGTEGSIYDDIDDYDGQSYAVTVYENETYATHQGDYLDSNISIISRVYYGDDTPRNVSNAAGTYQESTTFSNPFRNVITSNTTNIKLLTVQLTSSNPADEISDKQITLSAFMCNIGAPNPTLYNNR
jgi:type II secretory pathway pseudopilin PulG